MYNHFMKKPTDFRKISLEELQKIKKEHEIWVLSKLTVEDKKKLEDDFFYSEYIDNWVKYIYLSHWREWTYYLLNSDIPSLHSEVNDSLEQLTEYNFTRLWPQRYLELENSFFNFNLVLKDFMALFHRHSMYLRPFYTTEKFHKKEWHKDQKVFYKFCAFPGIELPMEIPFIFFMLGVDFVSLNLNFKEFLFAFL